MTMSWNLLLSDLRAPSKEGQPPKRATANDPFRSPFEADYDRVIFSPPFRRLARKTQVHPLAMNDHVHTRLTHSLEVASVGRSLGHRLAAFLKQQGQLPAGITEQDLIWIIQAACLTHDIGNPPFGHAGEYAIREWVRTHPREVFGQGGAAHNASLRNDLEYFEGNAQGFRMAARGDNSKTGYLRLTFASLGAMIKYPWDSSDSRAKAKGKLNVFSTERWIFDLLVEHMGLHLSDGQICRHPLSFLSEAADDICYRILDIEDAVEMGILHEERVRTIYLSMFESSEFINAPLALLRGQAIEALINGVWQVFETDYASIMQGQRQVDLKTDLSPLLSDAIARINTSYQDIFAERTKVAAELGAYNTLGRIVKSLCAATQELAEKQCFGETGFLDKRCLELAWGEDYASKNEKQTYEWWLHQVMDFVAGLTDNYARQFSREIEGI